MARRVSSTLEPREVRNNPDLFGQDILEAAELGLGIGVTGFVNDTFLVPIVKSAVPSAINNGVGAKVVDAITTFFSAFLVGKGVEMVDAPLGRTLMKGGTAYAGGKLITIAVPSFSISAKMPNPLSLGAPAMAALPAGGSASTSPAGGSNGGSGQTATALPAGSAKYVNSSYGNVPAAFQVGL